MLYIYPYKIGSGSAYALRDALSRKLGYRVKLVKPNGRFKPRRTDQVINWGNSTTPNWKWNTTDDYNNPNCVRIAANKLQTFQYLQGAGFTHIPEFTTDQQVAQDWINQGKTVFCRTVLNGNSGRGIVIADADHPLVASPLYVQYKKKKQEFRVHVFNGEVIDVQEKRKRTEFEGERDTRIRNLSNGYVFARENIVVPQQIKDVCYGAVATLGLQFGAVDVIWNEREQQAYVLEINTAPGLEGTTLVNYVKAFTNGN